MKSSILAIACICMTLGMTLAANYGSYGFPSYGYPSYGGGYGAQSSNPLGVGQGGLLMLFGFLILILLLTNSGIFNSTSTTTTPTFSLIGG